VVPGKFCWWLELVLDMQRQQEHLGNVFEYNGEDNFVAFRRKIMSSKLAEIATEAPPTPNPLDVIPNEIPFDGLMGVRYR
jgi:hypothetical protein